MNQENVVPFEISSRQAMARRGSPDKGFSRKLAELPCSYCGAALCLEPNPQALPDEVFCADCRVLLDLDGCGRVDSTG